MKKIIVGCLVVCFSLWHADVYSIPPEDISSFETVTSQAVSEDDLSSPYNITGESLINIIRGMVDFDVDGSTIVFNRRTGQIFVKHTPTEQTQIEHILNEMRETSFKQIEIEARLVTIGAVDFFGIGADLVGGDITGSHNGTTIGNAIPADSSSVANYANFSSFVNALDGTTTGDTTYGGQFSYQVLGDIFDLGAFVDALESKTEANTLAAPKITVFNNQRAHLKIEKRENFIAEVDANFDTVGNGITSVWFQLEAKVKQAQSGTILDVTPTINSDGTIGLEIHPVYVTADLTDSEDFVSITGGGSISNPVVLPVFQSQSIDTYLTVPNGGVAVLGGLITEEETKSFQKMPILGDIPVLGKFLFTQEKTTDDKKYLLIFIKAKVQT